MQQMNAIDRGATQQEDVRSRVEPKESNRNVPIICDFQ